jgi:DNA repair ATPase RecN
LHHRAQIAGALHTALGRAYDDDNGSAQAAVAAARQALNEVLEFDPGLATALQLLTEADIQIREAAGPDPPAHRYPRPGSGPGKRTR